MHKSITKINKREWKMDGWYTTVGKSEITKFSPENGFIVFTVFHRLNRCCHTTKKPLASVSECFSSLVHDTLHSIYFIFGCLHSFQFGVLCGEIDNASRYLCLFNSICSLSIAHLLNWFDFESEELLKPSSLNGKNEEFRAMRSVAQWCRE